ncbi:peptidase M15 [Streptomyces sp. RKND-216]|uniref:M15 family metallopeptidase n=1 Tax=Streptomyces sp. RKND-216 TaxID=2562581 RepID=UPI00109DDF2C|nr:M15 family metallopeptidase [Streptomyces sp. RKND-216]THA26432.1 peptidase M15 [Streptomyces sp. RKND-216]
MTRRHRGLRAALAAAMLVAGGVTVNVATAEPAVADSCYTWNRNLSRGASGSDVAQLQERIAGWAASGENIAIDGAFGPATEAALKRFQSAYGLSADGVAGPNTYSKIYSLQDGDCSPVHFDFSEFDDSCGENDFTGGRVSAAAAKQNIRRVMWQLEALRHKLGDRPIVITSGFRSVSCNSSVGGSSTSLHMSGQAADLGLGSGPSQCSMYNTAKTSGFEEILSQGYPGHNDHTHVGNKGSRFWSAPNC